MSPCTSGIISFCYSSGSSLCLPHLVPNEDLFFCIENEACVIGQGYNQQGHCRDHSYWHFLVNRYDISQSVCKTNESSGHLSYFKMVAGGHFEFFSLPNFPQTFKTGVGAHFFQFKLCSPEVGHKMTDLTVLS